MTRADAGCLAFALVLAAASMAANAASPDDSTYVGAERSTGWFFYKDNEKTVVKSKLPPKPDKPEPPPLAAAPPEKPKPKPKAQPKEEPMSAAWIRSRLPILQEQAMNNPTMENVRAYKYVERLMLDMSTNFTEMVTKVVQSDPILNEEVRFPIASAARTRALMQVSKAKEAILQDLSTRAGLWMFFDAGCAFCATQYDAVRDMAVKHGLTVRYITADGKPLPGMNPKDVLLDNGGERARALGIKITPAVVLVVPPKTLAIVAHGAMSRDALEEKVVLAAMDLEIAPPELTSVASLQQRGILAPADFAKLRHSALNTDDPKELVRAINQALVSKY